MIPEKVQESLTLALLGRVRDMKARGEDVVSFAAGEPDFDTPSLVVEEATRSMQSGNTRYVASQGQANLRKAIAVDYQERLSSSWVQPENIVVTGGAKQALYLLLDAVLEPEDEVLIPAPYWVSYPGIVEVIGARPQVMVCREEEDFFPTIEELNKAYNAKTKALVFSSPCNPTGKMISEKRLREIAEWCHNKKVYLLYDELYERLVLSEDRKHVCVLSLLDELKSEYIFSINATSKTLAMTGWRLGWIASHRENIKRLTAVQSQMVTCFPGFIQDAAVVGLKEAHQILSSVVTAYRKRRDLLMAGIEAIPDLKCIKPDGAFYLFVDVSKVIQKRGWESDKDFATHILDSEKVVVIPGSSMGMKGWLRLSFATHEEELKKGLDRLKRFCQ
jgi:aspartate aminotransferase